MRKGVLVVFTAKSVEQMFENGGTRSWALSPKSMRDVGYVVCTRNSDRQYDEECGERPEAHGSAFMVGKVSGIKPIPDLKAADLRNGRDRYLVQFSEYALVSIPNFRGHARNPVTYSDMDAVRRMGLDIEALDFSAMPPPKAEARSANKQLTDQVRGLSISEAKAGLSAYFGVPTDSIQITISG